MLLSDFIRKGSAMINPYTLRRRRGSAKSAGAACPPATQDIALNTKNRDRAIRMFDYGPPNPSLPAVWFWKKLAMRWTGGKAPSQEQMDEQDVTNRMMPTRREKVRVAHLPWELWQKF